MNRFQTILLESINGMIHPEKGEHEDTVFIKNPSEHSPIDTFFDKNKIACVVPGNKSNVPESLNGIDFKEYTPPSDWNNDEGINHSLEEPAIPRHTTGKRIAVGIIMKEPDGRIWIHEPTNHFAETEHSFPKGKAEHGLSLQANAIKEVYEETGLHARVLKHLMDIERSTSIARYYLGERIGGHPSKMGWESQSVKLVPQNRLQELLNVSYDHSIVDKLNQLNEGVEELRLKDVATVKTNFPDADYYIRRVGSEDTVGQVVNEYSPEHIGIKITRKDLILPEYHRHVMINNHLKGYWKNKCYGSLKLKNIRKEDVANMKLF